MYKKIILSILDTLYTLNSKKLIPEDHFIELIKNKKSIGRIGEGEIRLIKGENIEFNRFSEVLSKKLKNVKSDDKYILCLPSTIFLKCNKMNLKKESFSFWVINKFKYHKNWKFFLKTNGEIGDALTTRFFIDYKSPEKANRLVPKLKQIWNNQHIIFIEGYYTRLGFNNDLFDNANSIKRILCPPVNAFDKYDEILNYIIQNISKDYLLIIALGPTATVLTYDLSRLGYWALDLGHIDIEYEWFKLGATSKVAISNKYVNEAVGGKISTTIYDDKFTNQILKVF